MKTAGIVTALAVASVTASLVTGWVSIFAFIITDPLGYQVHTLAKVTEILLAVSVISVIGGTLPAFVALGAAFWFVRQSEG
ncbi:MAG: hypothetical protein U0975_13235 [Erythrobacter sp.]|nr:hypothetical protein [Erythrobacter sp.]